MDNYWHKPLKRIKDRIPYVARVGAGRAAGRVLDLVRGVDALQLATGKFDLSRTTAEHIPELFAGEAKVKTIRITQPVPQAHIIDIDGLPVYRVIDNAYVCIESASADISLRNNHVVGPNRLVITESRASFRELRISMERLEPVTYRPGTVAYLSNIWVDNYYHWLCFTLPNVRMLKATLGAAPNFYYVGSPLKRWHLETLAAFGVGEEQVVSGGTVADRIVASFPDRHGALDGPAISFVRETLLSHAKVQPPTRRLFIRRGRTRHRKVLNEAACVHLLEMYGFEILTMDGLSVRDQAELFSSAAFIVAPHGAALTNLLFASRSTKVLELLPHDASDSVYSYFAEICASVGCTYARLTGDRLADEAPRSNMQDIHIDIDKLDGAVARLLRFA